MIERTPIGGVLELQFRVGPHVQPGDRDCQNQLCQRALEAAKREMDKQCGAGNYAFEHGEVVVAPRKVDEEIAPQRHSAEYRVFYRCAKS